MGSSISSRPIVGAADWDNEGRAFSRLFSSKIQIRGSKDVEKGKDK